MKTKNSIKSKTKIEDIFALYREKAAFFFLGVGITMLILNMIAFFQLLPIIVYMISVVGTFPMHGFYVSIVSSVILITYSLYNIYVK